MGQPKKEIDWKELNALLQFKVSCKFCADYIGVSEDTIQRRIKETHNMTFAEYHELRMQRTAVTLQQKAIEQALKGNTALMIFALKNLAKWTDKQEILQETKVEIPAFEIAPYDPDKAV